MSMHAQLNITEESMAAFSPLDQLSPKYRKQVIEKSKVIIFDEGEQVFEKHHELSATYYLLAGKLTAKKGLLSSTTLEADTDKCKHPINSDIPDGVAVKAQTSGHMLLIDPKLLDRALAWTQSEHEEQAQQKRNQPTESEEEPQGEFDPEYFEWMTSLLEFPMFLKLPPTNLHALFAKFEKVDVQKDDVVIEEGSNGDYFYLLINGSARVLVGAAGTRVATLRPGAYFGEEALVADTVRSASVIMEEDGRLARLDKESFQTLLHDPLLQYVSYAAYKEKAKDTGSKVALLDIRSLTEFEYTPQPNCLHIPVDDLRQQLKQLDRETTYFLTDEGGQRNDIAAHILAQNRFNVFVIRG